MFSKNIHINLCGSHTVLFISLYNCGMLFQKASKSIAQKRFIRLYHIDSYKLIQESLISTPSWNQ